MVFISLCPINSLINFGLIDFDISVIIPALKEWDEYLCPSTSCIKLFTFAINVELLGVFKGLPFVVIIKSSSFELSLNTKCFLICLITSFEKKSFLSFLVLWVTIISSSFSKIVFISLTV